MTAKKTPGKKATPPRKRPSRSRSSQQCWAYYGTNPDDVVRCTEVAGHNGQHTYIIQWTDEETLDPMALAQMQAAAATLPSIAKPAAVTAAQAAQPNVDEVAAAAIAEGQPAQDIRRKCEACGHPFHGDVECMAVVRGEHGMMPCGCTTAV